ncbi:MAG: hypothetical protein ROY82_09475 [Truepera sp.]|nr:hypothetical protein [Truepera sp.]
MNRAPKRKAADERLALRQGAPPDRVATPARVDPGKAAGVEL